MKGRHKVIVQNNRLHYEFKVKRNITIILGDSATGKTTLIDMLRQNMNLGPDSGVDVICDVPCAVLEGRNWQAILGTYSQSIVLVARCEEWISLRDTPSLDGETIDQIPLGTYVIFVKTSTDDFWYVNYNGKLGYVLSRYLD